MNECPERRPSVGVGCVVFDGSGRVLLVQRSNPPQAGFWHIPGGRLEWGETLEACAKREVMEETGIEVRPKTIVAIADRSIEGFHYIIVDFLAELESGAEVTPCPSSDAAAAVWVAPADFNEYPLVEGIREVIESSLRPSSKSSLIPSASHAWLYVGAGSGLEHLVGEPCRG